MHLESALMEVNDVSLFFFSHLLVLPLLKKNKCIKDFIACELFCSLISFKKETCKI